MQSLARNWEATIDASIIVNADAGIMEYIFVVKGQQLKTVYAVVKAATLWLRSLKLG